MSQWVMAHFEDRKSTRLNSSHLVISYVVFCLKKKITGFNYLLFDFCCVFSRRLIVLIFFHVRHFLKRICCKVSFWFSCVFFFNDTATPEIYPLSLHEALQI